MNKQKLETPRRRTDRSGGAFVELYTISGPPRSGVARSGGGRRASPEIVLVLGTILQNYYIFVFFFFFFLWTFPWQKGLISYGYMRKYGKYTFEVTRSDPARPFSAKQPWKTRAAPMDSSVISAIESIINARRKNCEEDNRAVTGFLHADVNAAWSIGGRSCGDGDRGCRVCGAVRRGGCRHGRPGSGGGIG